MFIPILLLVIFVVFIIGKFQQLNNEINYLNSRIDELEEKLGLGEDEDN